MTFKQRLLFHIPKLELGPRDVVYLKGDNGIGKTTLLKILAGLLYPTGGSVNQLRPSLFKRLFKTNTQNGVIYLHQSPYLFDGSVYQNVVYGIKYGPDSKRNKRNQVINALRMVGLETLADEHVSLLSGGEKQRVAMARAWILNPSILLMDEPSASLDQESIERLVVMCQDLIDKGSSLVITSHQENALTQLCTKQWHLKQQTLHESPALKVVVPHDNENKYVASN
ncbi:energy-coupling factor ABC transporter ATP-binding protein [Vibrio sp. SCSIO 43136]|nr:energy-coupling factor ABC transporter ATP-binding protein [Vibrio sp. SCSIO 43136]